MRFATVNRMEPTNARHSLAQTRTRRAHAPRPERLTASGMESGMACARRREDVEASGPDAQVSRGAACHVAVDVDWLGRLSFQHEFRALKVAGAGVFDERTAQQLWKMPGDGRGRHCLDQADIEQAVGALGSGGQAHDAAAGPLEVSGADVEPTAVECGLIGLHSDVGVAIGGEGAQEPDPIAPAGSEPALDGGRRLPEDFAGEAEADKGEGVADWVGYVSETQARTHLMTALR